MLGAVFGGHQHTVAHTHTRFAQFGFQRIDLLRQLAQTLATERPVPPDLCYLHHFDAPERPRALRMPAGQGRELRHLMAQLVRFVQTEIPQRLGSEDFKAESERLQSAYRNEEAKAYAELDAFAEASGFNYMGGTGGQGRLGQLPRDTA